MGSCRGSGPARLGPTGVRNGRNVPLAQLRAPALCACPSTGVRPLGRKQLLCLHWEKLWVALSGWSWPVWLDLVDVTFTLQAPRAQIQEPASERENPFKNWSWFALTAKELLQTFLWPGVEFRSLAWPLLPQPFSLLLFLSQSFHVLELCSPSLTAWQGLHSMPLGHS